MRLIRPWLYHMFGTHLDRNRQWYPRRGQALDICSLTGLTSSEILQSLASPRIHAIVLFAHGECYGISDTLKLLAHNINRVY